MIELLIIFVLLVTCGLLLMRYRDLKAKYDVLRVEYADLTHDVAAIVREEIRQNLKQMLRVYRRMCGYGATRGRQLLRECVMNLYAEAHQMHSTLLAFEELVNIERLPVDEGQAMNFKEYFRLYALNNLNDVVAYGFESFAEVMEEIESLHARMQ